jgi:hypothetical protein
VLMHGSLVHMSYENKSDQSRQAFTLHIVEGPPHATYPADNWYSSFLLSLIPYNNPHPQPIDVLCSLTLLAAVLCCVQAAATLQPAQGLLRRDPSNKCRPAPATAPTNNEQPTTNKPEGIGAHVGLPTSNISTTQLLAIIRGGVFCIHEIKWRSRPNSALQANGCLLPAFRNR